MTCKRGRGGVGEEERIRGRRGRKGWGGRGKGRERRKEGGKGGKEGEKEGGRREERGEGEGTHFLELLLLSSDLLLEGCHHPLVCLSPKHFVRLSARSKVCTLHEEETS